MDFPTFLFHPFRVFPLTKKQFIINTKERKRSSLSNTPTQCLISGRKWVQIINVNQIPAIEFPINSREVDQGTDEWHHLCKRALEVCENYGQELKASLCQGNFSAFHLRQRTLIQALNKPPTVNPLEA